jgi:hypothetical protein
MDLRLPYRKQGILYPLLALRRYGQDLLKGPFCPDIATCC